MYQIHTTPGFVIESRPSGEAGRVLSIFTRDLGLVRASAQGIRLEKSKLRYFTQEYSFGVFSLVRGREYWRLTGGETSPDWGGLASANVELKARIAVLLRRLLHGEEPNQALFECIRGGETSPIWGGLASPDLQSLESLVVLRMLHSLGYVGSAQTLEKYLQSTDITPELLSEAATNRILINQHINKALRESHL